MTAMHVPYRHGLAEGKANELACRLDINDPKTFAVKALFEQRRIEFAD